MSSVKDIYNNFVNTVKVTALNKNLKVIDNRFYECQLCGEKFDFQKLIIEIGNKALIRCPCCKLKLGYIEVKEKIHFVFR